VLTTPSYCRFTPFAATLSAEVWSAAGNNVSSSEGAQLLRTFHEEANVAARKEPLRLSFYGGGHYDPLVQTR
jgi:hypothetical protein